MVLGDDNAVGGLIVDATKSLKKLKQSATPQDKTLITDLIQTISSLGRNPNILQTDGYSLVQYLRMLTKHDIDSRTLRMVSDALSSYDDDSSD